MSSEKKNETTIGPIRSSARNQCPRNIRTPYSRKYTTDNNNLRIENRSQDAISENVLTHFEKQLIEEEQLFKDLLNLYHENILQTEHDLKCGDYFLREHCNEIRRRVQLAKETRIQSLEEISEKLLAKIDEHEREISETILKANNDTFLARLNKMKLDLDEWNDCLDKHLVDSKLIENANERLLNFAFERINIDRFLLNGQFLYFEEDSKINKLGEVYSICMNSFDENGTDKFDLKEFYQEIKKNNLIEVKRLKILHFLSNRDVLIVGINWLSVWFFIYDIQNKTSKKKIKFKVDGIEDKFSFQTVSNKICIIYKEQRAYDYQLPNEDVPNPNEVVTNRTNEEESWLFSVLDNNLEISHQRREKFNISFDENISLIGANDSFLFIYSSYEHEKGLYIYDWSLEKIRKMDRNNKLGRPFHKPLMYNFDEKSSDKIVSVDEKYYLITDKLYDSYDRKVLSIIDEETEKLLLQIEAKQFLMDTKKNLILIDEKSIKYFNSKGDFKYEVELDRKYENFNWSLNQNDQLCFVDEERKMIIIEKKYK